MIFHAYNLLIGEDFTIFFGHHLSFCTPGGAGDTLFEPKLFAGQSKVVIKVLKSRNDVKRTGPYLVRGCLS